MQIQTYIIHYYGKQGACVASERGKDVFQAVQTFMELRKLSSIYSIRRCINGHATGPVYL